jgi:hypothetical protein
MLLGLDTAKPWSLVGTAPYIKYFAYHTLEAVILISHNK